MMTVTKNTASLVFALAILLGASLSCTSLKDKVSQLGLGDDGGVTVPDIPAFDPNGPMVSPGAYVIRLMAKDEPELAAVANEIESAERKLMKQALEEYKPSAPRADINVSRPASSVQRTIRAAFQQPVAAHLMLQAGELPLPTVTDGVVFGAFTGYLKSMLAGAVTEGGSMSKKDSKTEPVEGGTSIMHLEIALNSDGSSAFEIGIITETEKNGVKTRTEMKTRIEGQDCPNAEGQVPITVKLRLGGQSGSSRYEQDVTALIRLVVDDNADVVSSTIDITQATNRRRNGHNYFIETGGTVRRNPGESHRTFSNRYLTQNTDGATVADVNEAMASGYSVAMGAAEAAMSAAESAWKGGACIAIDARSPGSVGPNSGTEIPVKVMHRKEGSEVAAKLEAKLVGEASIDPDVIPRTAGTLMYIAPAETGKSATIELRAVSRRGIARLDLKASTGTNSYRIVGGLDDWQTDTVVCDITKPFTLTGGGFTMKLSGGHSGTYEYSGPFNAKGTGTYEMTFPYGVDKAGQMIGRGAGTITGGGQVYGGSGTEKYTLTTVDGECVDGPSK